MSKKPNKYRRYGMFWSTKSMFTSIIGKIYFGELVNSLKILSFIGETIMILVIGEIVKKEIVGSTRFYIGDKISPVKKKNIVELG